MAAANVGRLLYNYTPAAFKLRVPVNFIFAAAINRESPFESALFSRVLQRIFSSLSRRAASSVKRPLSVRTSASFLSVRSELANIRTPSSHPRTERQRKLLSSVTAQCVRASADAFTAAWTHSVISFRAVAKAKAICTQCLSMASGLRVALARGLHVDPQRAEYSGRERDSQLNI